MITVRNIGRIRYTVAHRRAFWLVMHENSREAMHNEGSTENIWQDK